jgi:hypothetical protein
VGAASLPGAIINPTVAAHLTGGIEEAEGIGVVADHDGHGIIVEDGRDVFRGELRCRQGLER